jgi:hypothetical protein
MAQLVWDDTGHRIFETGVDRGVLYIPNGAGVYINGVAWNGLTTVTEKPTGAEPNAKYADNIKYLNLYSAEEFGATLEAFTYPDEFAPFDGLAIPVPGIAVGQQARRSFGLCYRSRLGNDVEGDDYGYKLHLVYGATASPSEKAYGTVNDSPDNTSFSWDLTTQPVDVPGLRRTSIVTLDSTKLDPTALAALERILYGDAGIDPSLPLPGVVIDMFAGTIITVTPAEPAFNPATNTITIPTVAGVTYEIGGDPVPSGPVIITEDTLVTAVPNSGYVFTPGVDDDWFYNFT